MTRRTPFTLLALGVAALLSSWNPASAPLGLAVGLVAAGLCVKALKESQERAPVLRAALVVAAVAVVVSGAVFARAVGAGRDHWGAPIVQGIPQTERTEALDKAAEATRAGRDAARKELDALEPKR